MHKLCACTLPLQYVICKIGVQSFRAPDCHTGPAHNFKLLFLLSAQVLKGLHQIEDEKLEQLSSPHRQSLSALSQH